MMRITETPHGWTVMNDSGFVMLVNPDRTPLFRATRELVLRDCHDNGFYEVREGNPDNLPAGVLVTLAIGNRAINQGG